MSSSKKKILHVIDTLGLGGAQTIIKDVVEHWNASGIQLWVFGLRKTEILIQINSPHVVVHDSASKYSFEAVNSLVKLIKDENIDVIHAHLPKSLWIAYLVKRFYLPHIKLIYHEHGDVFGNESKIDFFIHKIGVKVLLNSFEKVIGVSKTTSSAIGGLNGKLIPRVTTIHNFADLEKFKPIPINEKKTLRKAYDIEETDFIIGFVGRMVKQKGLPTLIHALARLDIPFKAVLVGDGYLKDEIQGLVSTANLDEKVQFWGYRTDVVQIMQIFDVMVMSSLWEASPMALFEALGSGVPVIVNDIPVLAEYIAEQEEAVGLLFKYNDVADLSHCITKLYDEPSYKKMLGEKAHTHAQAYSLRNYISQLKDLYYQL